MTLMDQQIFLRLARNALGLPNHKLAQELGVSERTIEKWSMRSTSGDRRAMPLMAIRLVLRMLDDRKRELLAMGDRNAAEVLDAIGAQVDSSRRAASMRAFDALQRSARRLMPLEPARRKPRYFATLAQKNTWERRQEIRHARRIQAAATPGKR